MFSKRSSTLRVYPAHCPPSGPAIVLCGFDVSFAFARKSACDSALSADLPHPFASLTHGLTAHACYFDAPGRLDNRESLLLFQLLLRLLWHIERQYTAAAVEAQALS